MNDKNFSDPFFHEMFKSMDVDFDVLVMRGMRLNPHHKHMPHGVKTLSAHQRALYVAKYAFSQCLGLYTRINTTPERAIDSTVQILQYKLWLAGMDRNTVAGALTDGVRDFAQQILARQEKLADQITALANQITH